MNQDQLGKPQTRYSLAHQLSKTRTNVGGSLQQVTTRYGTTPIKFDRPATGTKHMVVTCRQCNKEVTVVVRSPGAVTRERVKNAAYVLVVVPAFYVLARFVPWSRIVGSANEGFVAFVLLAAFAVAAWEFGSKVFAPDAALTVGIAADPGSHTILRSQK